MAAFAVLLGFFAAVGFLTTCFIASVLVTWAMLKPWSPEDRDHSVAVAALPMALFRFGCWTRALGQWLASLVPSPMLAVEKASAFLTSQVLFTLVDLDVPQALRGGPMTAHELASACGCQEEWLARVLDAAAALGFLARRWRRQPQNASKNGGGGGGGGKEGAVLVEYAANSLTACLCRRHKSSVAAMVRLYRYNYESALRLAESVREGVPSHELVAGRGFWQGLAADAAKGRVFDEAMTSFKDLGGASVVVGHDWGRYACVVDVAGGNGSFLASLLAAHPRLRGVVVDQREQIQRGKEWWQAHAPGLAPRAKLQAGDMLDPSALPPPAAALAGTGAGPAAGAAAAAGPGPLVAYVLRNILHNWPDADALRILRALRAAVPPADEARARLVIIELTASAAGLQPLLEPRLLADIQMLCLFGGGRERGVRQFAALLARAGWRLAGAAPTKGLLVVMEAVPAAAGGAPPGDVSSG